MPTFRTLVERAMTELRDELLDRAAAKLDGLLRLPVSELPAKRGPGRPRKPLAIEPVKRRGRKPSVDLGSLEQKITQALKSGASLKRSEISKTARLTAGEDDRLAQALAKMKSQGALKMKGQRGSARYSLA